MVSDSFMSTKVNYLEQNWVGKLVKSDTEGDWDATMCVEFVCFSFICLLSQTECLVNDKFHISEELYREQRWYTKRSQRANQHGVVKIESSVTQRFRGDRFTAVYDSKSWPMTKKDETRMSVMGTKMLKWCLDLARLERIKYIWQSERWVFFFKISIVLIKNFPVISNESADYGRFIGKSHSNDLFCLLAIKQTLFDVNFFGIILECFGHHWENLNSISENI